MKRRRGRKRALGTRTPMPLPEAPGKRWSLDFVSDVFGPGRRFRILAVNDDVTRECLGLIADTSISGRRVARELDAVVRLYGKPETIVSDNGTELTSRAMLEWQISTRSHNPFCTAASPCCFLASRHNKVLVECSCISSRLDILPKNMAEGESQPCNGREIMKSDTINSGNAIRQPLLNTSAVLTVIAAIGVLATPIGAAAQEAALEVVEDEDATEKTEDQVIVTGSRIKRSAFDAPQPTNVVTAEGIQLAGTPNLLEVLNEQPQISNGFFNQNTSFSFGNIGLNQLNLRDLGVNRTLTIVNGRRRAGTPDDSNFLAFDLNNIPSSMIDRVEIITGGTSAVYGADAVAGVINIILKEDFEGVQLDGVVGGNLDEGDYSYYNYGLTVGGNFADGRGNAVLHVGRTQNSRLNKRDRGLDVEKLRFLSNPANTSSSDGIPNRLVFEDVKFAFFGIPTITTFASLAPDGVTPDPNGNTLIWDSSLNRFRGFECGRGAPGCDIDGFASLGADGGRGRFFDTLVAPIRRTNVYAKADYEIFDNLRVKSEFIFSDSRSSDIIGPVFDVFSTFISTDNAFMPQETRDALNASGDGGFSLSRQHNEFGPRGADVDRRYWSAAVGLEGDVLNDRFNWELVFENGETSTENTNLNDRIDERWFAAADSIIVGGVPVCRDEFWRAQGCVPVNIFGEGTISQAAVDWIGVDHTTSTRTRQELFQGVITGNLFELPAGSVGMAAGIEYRKDSLDFRPSFIWEQALGFFASQFSPVKATNDVKEAFGELRVPVLKDLPLIDDLVIEGAYRISDYERAGTTKSWKAGGTWQISEDLRIRGTRARAVRAPSLGELFDPGSRGAFSISDPCDPFLLDSGTASRRANCLALGLDPVTFDPDTRRVTTLGFTTGNPDLDVEIGNTFTVGGIITPRWTPGLQIAVDYFDINLANSINRIGPSLIVNNCVDSETLNNQFCDLVTRDPVSGNIREVQDTFVNVNGQIVRGLDVQASYLLDVNDFAQLLGRSSSVDLGQLRFNYIGSRMFTNVFIERNDLTVAESEFERVGLSNRPKWRMVMNALYSRDNYGARWQGRYAHGTQTNVPLTPANIENNGDAAFIPAIWYHDVSAYYVTDFGVRIYGGITNVFDKGPRQHPFTISGSNIIDDVIGRRFFIGAQVNLGGAN